jgi:hypothetical protein
MTMKHHPRILVALLLVPLAALAGSSPVAPFSRNAVRLTPSVWLDAQKRDGEYPLSLKPDRLLYCFCVTAGLPAPGQSCEGITRAVLSTRSGEKAISCQLKHLPSIVPRWVPLLLAARQNSIGF